MVGSVDVMCFLGVLAMVGCVGDIVLLGVLVIIMWLLEV